MKSTFTNDNMDRFETLFHQVSQGYAPLPHGGGWGPSNSDAGNNSDEQRDQQQQQRSRDQQQRQNRIAEPASTFLGEDASSSSNASRNKKYQLVPAESNDPSALRSTSSMIGGEADQQISHNFAAASNNSTSLKDGDFIPLASQCRACCHQPLRVLLVRHGEAEGNVDRTVFTRVPDHAIPLTESGREMARRTGRAIGKFFRDTFGDPEAADHHFRMMVSPFLRTRQTAECILEGLREGQLDDYKEQKVFEEAEAADRQEQKRREKMMMVMETTKGNDRGNNNRTNSDDKTKDEQVHDNVHQQSSDDTNDNDSKRNNNNNHNNNNNSNNSSDAPRFWIDSIRESPFLAEQDFGAMEGTGEMAQSKYKGEVERMNLQRNFLGTFWARAPHGESYFQVCNRLVGVISDIVTAAKMTSTTSTRHQPVRTVIVVTHGVTLRAFLSVWCHYSPEWLATSQNPPNCSVRLLTGSQDCGYIHGGWNSKAELDQYPQGVPLDHIKIETDASRETWANVLGRIRDRDGAVQREKKAADKGETPQDDDDDDGAGTSWAHHNSHSKMPCPAQSWM